MMKEELIKYHDGAETTISAAKEVRKELAPDNKFLLWEVLRQLKPKEEEQ